MINPLPHLKLSFVLYICIALLSCTSEKPSSHSDGTLSKSLASEIIKDTYGFPISRTELFQYGEINYSRHFGGSLMSEQNYLAEHDLIRFVYKGVKKDSYFMFDSYDLAMTSSGDAHRVDETSTPDGRRFYSMQAADVKFHKVTEILQSTKDSSAQVEFTWSYSNITPFGIASNLRVRANRDMCGLPYIGDEYQEGKIYYESVVFMNEQGKWRIQPPLALRDGLIQVKAAQ